MSSVGWRRTSPCRNRPRTGDREKRDGFYLTGQSRSPQYIGSRCIESLCLRGAMDTELLKGTLSLLILSLLSRKPMYGYEIAATVHRDTDGTFTWREGSLYPNLHKLQADGLIVGEWEEKETGRKRRYYHLTKKGRAALKEKVQSWT